MIRPLLTGDREEAFRWARADVAELGTPQTVTGAAYLTNWGPDGVFGVIDGDGSHLPREGNRPWKWIEVIRPDVLFVNEPVANAIAEPRTAKQNRSIVEQGALDL